MKRYIILCALVMLSSCASPSRGWTKPGSTQADFNMDAGQCRAQAYSVPGAPVMQIAIVYASCLQGKGWTNE